MDISSTTAPRSDQLNYDDVAATSYTVTVSEVRKGTTEQPVEVHLVEFPGRPFKPSKSMRRVMVAAWGADSSAYAGRRMTLYGDPSVKFGGQAVGGIRISHMSNIDKVLTVNLTVTRGKRAPFKVQPLTAPQSSSVQHSDDLPEPTADEVEACMDESVLREWWARSSPERRAQIEERVAVFRAAAEKK